MPASPDLPRIRPLTLALMRRVARRYFRRHFRAVQVQHPERLIAATGPLIVYGNHSSWWDPLLQIVLAEQLLPSRRHYAPMDAAQLARYPIFARLGVFPVAATTTRGVATFLRTAEAILASNGVLWITPQARFADVRERPLAFRAGLATVAARVPHAQLIAVAAEYAFWNERLPEALVHIAEPWSFTGLDPAQRSQVTTLHAEAVLEAAMQQLASDSMRRDPALFTQLLSGGHGSGGVYALWQSLKQALAGDRASDDHLRSDIRKEDLP